MLRGIPSVLFCTLTAFLFKSCFPDPTKIHPDLSAILAETGKASVVVSFRDGIMSTLDSATALRYDDRGVKYTAIKAALVENSDRSQAGVLQTLSVGEGDDFLYYRQYWSTNKILIKEASAEMVNQVSEDPEVKMITPLPTFDCPEDEKPYNVGTKTGSGSDELTWGLKRIQVPEAWDELGGNRGEGVVVGIIDSGVLATHEALRDNFIGTEYGWYDPNRLIPEPYDDTGHGTHVTGTIVGSHGIGVAPGVKWMLCKNSVAQSCQAEGTMDCFEWMSCPTLPDESDPDCSKAPHIINNSWGLPDYEYFNYFDEDLMRFRAMGILVVFSLGNGGLFCTNNGPGNTELVIGVGAMAANDTVPAFSSTGPGIDGNPKPDGPKRDPKFHQAEILMGLRKGPGVGVLSSVMDADDSYGLMDGTSMAAPHVAGVLALLKVRDPDLTFEEARELLIQNTDQIPFAVPPDGEICRERNNSDGIPNIYSGYGVVNALKAVKAQTLILNHRKKK